MMTIAVVIFGIAAAFTAIFALWGVLSLIGWLVRRYRKKIWQTALYIAQERPDLLAEVSEILEVPDSSEVNVPAVITHRRTTRTESIHTVPRRQLEDHCLQLESAALRIRDKWVEEYQEKEHWKAIAEHKEMLRARYWSRLRRVCIAERDPDGDIFTALHPALARMAS